VTDNHLVRRELVLDEEKLAEYRQTPAGKRLFLASRDRDRTDDLHARLWRHERQRVVVVVGLQARVNAGAFWLE
jgi:hypothetical protein